MTPDGDRKLTEDEMDVLLQDEESSQPPLNSTEQPRGAKRYDFRQPSRLDSAALDELRRIHDGLADHATSAASRLLRQSVKARLVSMEHVKWEELLAEFRDSVTVFLFVMRPLGHCGLVFVDRKLSVLCVDRMMGGSSVPDDRAERLSGLDLRVLAGFVKAFLDPLPRLWERIGRFEVDMGGHVEDMDRLYLFHNDQDIFQASFLLQGDSVSGQIVLSVPLRVARSLQTKSEEQATGDVASEEGQTLLQESLSKTPVRLSILLGTADVRVRSLAGLMPGDLVMLNTRVEEPLDVRVNDNVKLQGYLGTCRGKMAVRLIMEANR